MDFILDNSKFEENLTRIKEVFVEDFIKQLEIILKKSEIYKTSN